MKKNFRTGLMCVLAVASFSLNSVNAEPTLKYKNAGTLGNWTEESYYSSPEVCDLEGDGTLEIVFSNYSITVLNANDGSEKWKVNSGYDRNTAFSQFGKSVGHTWCDVIVKDMDGDGNKEIITGHGNGLVSVLDHNGYFKYGWPQTPTDGSVRSVKVEDLDGDGKCEVILGYGKPSYTSVYVLNYDGTLRNGWPKLKYGEEGNEGWGYGVFMNGISVSDLDYNGTKEVIVPTDNSFISVYEHDGRPVKANEEVYGGRNWGYVALYEDYNSEIRGDNGGWGDEVVGGELREELYKAEFGHAITKVDDLDGDGKKEIVTSAIMCNRKYPVYPPSEYMTIAILNSDRTRYKNDSLDADWTTIPTDLGKPFIQNEISISSFVCQTPVISDIDGNGMKEILFNSYNGKVYCFSLDKTEPYAWPFSLTKRTSPLYEYSSPVATVDIDYDGKQEIIFTSYYDEYQNLPGIVQGSLYVLDYMGRVISKTTLPPATEAYNKNNGAMSKPVVMDIDYDGKYEVVINTLHGAICVYDL